MLGRHLAVLLLLLALTGSPFAYGPAESLAAWAMMGQKLYSVAASDDAKLQGDRYRVTPALLKASAFLSGRVILVTGAQGLASDPDSGRLYRHPGPRRGGRRTPLAAAPWSPLTPMTAGRA